MKKTDLGELSSKYRITDYNLLYEKIIGLIDNGRIKPVKASGINGKKPALYNKYWIVEDKPDYGKYIKELQYEICPAISNAYYLQHIEQYIEDRRWVLLLNGYFMDKKDRLGVPMSMNERSFDIWHREKFIKQEQGRKILKRCGIMPEELNFYETIEPLAYYVHTRNTPQNMLILENKDTFYSFRKYMIDKAVPNADMGGAEIFGYPIGTLIYGAGKGIVRSFEDFRGCSEPYMQETGNEIYYFGDLDYEGIGIYESLVKGQKGKINIKPFCAAYRKMIEKAPDIGMLPETKEGQNRNAKDVFFSYFDKKDVSLMRKILEAGRYIPQEIIVSEDLA